MFPNLLGMKAYHHMSNEDMARVIGLSRNSYEQKIKSGRFTPWECSAFCSFFGKDFDYLFRLEDTPVSPSSK